MTTFEIGDRVTVAPDVLNRAYHGCGGTVIKTQIVASGSLRDPLPPYQRVEVAWDQPNSLHCWSTEGAARFFQPLTVLTEEQAPCCDPPIG